MARLGAETSQIRLGSGGVMLPNHSAFKVAENFRMLEALYPGRIDLGIGRAPGGDGVSAKLLNPSSTFQEDDYIQQLQQLNHFFRDHGVPWVQGCPTISSNGCQAPVLPKYRRGPEICTGWKESIGHGNK